MSSDHPAIRVRGLGKKYAIGGPQEKYLTFRDAIVDSVKAPLRRLSSPDPSQEFWALKDVSFDVEQGEVVGIIGRNGAGKSTLLKILSRITSPTEGTVDLYGRVGSLLEVGTGFHPELTGRENIFLSGSILGMKRSEIDAKLDDIVKFSEIEKFLDTPTKRYSSGMYVRLAFAVAAHLEPEILLVDEVLAVGDAAFQKKCLGKMGDIAKEGRTVLFVSHNMGAVSNLCSISVLISHGRIDFQGSTQETIKKYLQGIMEKKATSVFFNKDLTKEISILSVQVSSSSYPETGKFEISDEIELKIQYNVKDDIEGTNIYLGLDHSGINILKLFDIDYNKELFLLRKKGLHTLKVIFPKFFLNIGEWSISINAGRPNIGVIDRQHNCLNFFIENNYLDQTYSGFSRGGAIIAPLLSLSDNLDLNNVD